MKKTLEELCEVAPGTTSYQDSGKKNVDTHNSFNLCFQAADSDQFCWGKSFLYHSFNYGGYVGCYPYGMDGAAVEPGHWHDTSGRGDSNCRSPCHKFC